jgi:hypothetical protein
VSAAFYDPGRNVSVYNWTAGAGTTSIVNDTNNGGYLVTYPIPANNSAAISGSLSGTVPASIPAAVPARAIIELNTTNVAPDLTYSLTLTSTSGATFTAPLQRGYYYNPYYAYNAAYTTSVPPGFNVASFTLTYTVPAGDVQNPGNTATIGTFDIAYLGVTGQFLPSTIIGGN